MQRDDDLARRLLALKARLLEVPVLRRAAHLAVRPLEPRAWVFVLGCYNSGTTLLARLLACHPELYGLPKEGAALSPELSRPEDLGWTRMWVACPDHVGPPPGDGTAAALRLRRDWALFAERRGGDILVEKSISNLPRAEWLARHLRPAQFVGIMRDPWAVAEGIRRKARPRGTAAAAFPQGYDVGQTTRQWLAANRELRRLAGGVLDVHMIRYEDLAREPDRVLAGAFDHLGVARPAMSWADGRLAIGGESIAIRDMNASSIAGLTEAEVALVSDTLGDEAAAFGYAPPA